MCSDGRPRSLSDYAGQNLLLVFLRHLGCLPCREHASQLWHQRSAFQELDTEVLLVSFESLDRIEWYLADVGLGWPVLSDPERAAYRAYGLGRASVARAWLSPRTVAFYARAVWHGSPLHRPRADTQQLGGDFLIDSAGIVRLAYRSQEPADRPSVDELLGITRGLPAQKR